MRSPSIHHGRRVAAYARRAVKSVVGFAFALTVLFSPCRASADIADDVAMIEMYLFELINFISDEGSQWNVSDLEANAKLAQLVSHLSNLNNAVSEIALNLRTVASTVRDQVMQTHDAKLLAMLQNYGTGSEWNVIDEAVYEDTEALVSMVEHIIRTCWSRLDEILQGAYDEDNGAWNVYNEDALTYLQGMNDVLEMELPTMASSVGSLVNFARNIYGDVHTYLPSIYNNVDSYLPLIYEALSNMNGGGGSNTNLSDQITQGIQGGLDSWVQDLRDALENISVTAEIPPSDLEVTVAGISRDAANTIQDAISAALASNSPTGGVDRWDQLFTRLDDFQPMIDLYTKWADGPTSFAIPYYKWNDNFSNTTNSTGRLKLPFDVSPESHSGSGDFFDVILANLHALALGSYTQQRTQLEILKLLVQQDKEGDDLENANSGRISDLSASLDALLHSYDFGSGFNAFEVYDILTENPFENSGDFFGSGISGFDVNFGSYEFGGQNVDFTGSLSLDENLSTFAETCRSFAKFAWWAFAFLVSASVFFFFYRLALKVYSFFMNVSGTA